MGCRSWMQIWPKFYHCNCCICIILSYITEIYREPIAYKWRLQILPRGGRSLIGLWHHPTRNFPRSQTMALWIKGLRRQQDMCAACRQQVWPKTYGCCICGRGGKVFRYRRVLAKIHVAIYEGVLCQKQVSCMPLCTSQQKCQNDHVSLNHPVTLEFSEQWTFHFLVYFIWTAPHINAPVRSVQIPLRW